MSKLGCGAAAILIASLICSQSNAGVMISAVGVTASDERVFGSTTWFANSLIDQSELSTPFISGLTNFEAYVASSPTHRFVQIGSTISGWGTNNFVTSATLDFDMGGATLLDALVLWNRGVQTNQQIGDFDLIASNDASFTNTTLLGSFSASGNGTDLATGAQVFTFQEISASYIRMNITSPLPRGIILSAGEIAFGSGTTSVVPEPSSLAIFGVGACVVGATRRRSSKRGPI